MKISLIVTARDSGVEVIPFLKIGAVLPGALIFTYIFTKLINRYSRERVFYTILGGFLIYFVCFLFVLFPRHDALSLDLIADFFQDYLFVTSGFKGLIALIRHFNLTCFYVIAEMWSTVVLSILFWGFANEVTKLHEAKRFYAIFALGANCSGIFSGVFARWIEMIPYIPYLPLHDGTQWVFFQLTSIVIIGIVVLALFHKLNRSVFHLENLESGQVPKKGNKLTMFECFRYLGRSRYLGYIVVIVLGYNIVYNLSDVMWTYKVEEIYRYSVDVNAYMNRITSITGIVAVVLAFIVSGNVIRYYGWIVTALIAPIVWLLTSISFFSGLVFDCALVVEIVLLFCSNPANLILLLGSVQMCLGRACKYTVFDETKEIAFIPLPKDNQRKGKAIVDGLASRFGKSGGSLVFILILLVCGDIVTTIPYVALIIFMFITFWIYAVYKLGLMVTESIDKEISEMDAERAAMDASNGVKT